MAGENKFAVLIDADNISEKYIKFIMDEISNEGVATYKRIYGDWTKPSFSSWKSVLLEHSITPIQQYGYTQGKNATDSAMIIDAMDILYSGNVEGFCLVTSDSDFTRLAARLRESGMDVVGMGERKTPKAFISACNKFKYLDILLEQSEKEKEQLRKEIEDRINGTQKSKKEKIKINLPEGFLEEDEEMTSLETIVDSVISIIREKSDEDGWVFIGDLGGMLLKRHPDFDVRNFGFNKLTPFISSIPDLEIRADRHGNINLMYVREGTKKEQPEKK
ncbi:MAG: NYN domain-containing protein [Clostridiales bacterium]|nr:NYN domain-containing protein [Clostridiales bacterium]